MSTQKVKVSFNKPAFNAFFDGQDAAGVQIRLRNGVVSFRPVDKERLAAEDVVPLYVNKRGGFHIFIGDGYESDEIVDALQSPFSAYFRLQRSDNGWIDASPYSGYDAVYGTSNRDGEPNRWMPHVRVWNVPRVSGRKLVTNDPARVADLVMKTFFNNLKLCQSDESLKALRSMADLFTNLSGIINTHVRTVGSAKDEPKRSLKTTVRGAETIKKRPHHSIARNARRDVEPQAEPLGTTTSSAPKERHQKHSRYLRKFTD